MNNLATILLKFFIKISCIQFFVIFGFIAQIYWYIFKINNILKKKNKRIVIKPNEFYKINKYPQKEPSKILYKFPPR